MHNYSLFLIGDGELFLSDGKSFAETCNTFMAKTLFVIVDGDHIVCIWCFQWVSIVKLFNQLNISHIRFFTLDLISYAIVKSSNHWICLEHPPVLCKIRSLPNIFVLQLCVIGWLTIARNFFGPTPFLFDVDEFELDFINI